MSDEEQKRQITNEIERDRIAQQVIDNPEYQRAYMEYRAELFDSFTKTTYDEIEVREEIYRQMKSLDQVQHKFEYILQTGNLAKEQLTAWQKAKQSLGAK